MWDSILELAVKNGLWAVLFSALLIFVLKDSNKRENEYQQTIKQLTVHLGIVNQIKQEVEEVKNMVLSKNKKSNSKKGENANEK